MSRRYIFCFLMLVLLTLPVSAKLDKSSSLVSPSLVEYAGLSVNWQMILAVKETEKLDRMYVFGKYLYVLTSQNYLVCINRDRGSIRFELQLAPAGLPIYHPYYYDKKLWFMVGAELLVVDPEVGEVIESRLFKTLGGSAMCPLVRNKERIYIAGLDHRLQAITASNYMADFGVSAYDNSRINSVLAADGFVVFSTERGNIIGIAPDGPQKRWQRDVSGRVSASLVKDGEHVYVPCEDTKLYKFNALTGENAWSLPFQTGNAILDPPIIGAKVVYQYIDVQGLYAVNKDSGRKIWQLEAGLNLLAENGDLAYIIAQPGSLVVMNNSTGKEMYSVNFAAVTDYAVNTTDSSFYIADNTGRVMSIKTKGPQK